MGQYIIKRLALFIPSLFFITLIGFTILQCAPGDPIERMMHKGLNTNVATNATTSLLQKKHWQHQLGLDLPLFYFSILPLSHPDTLYKLYSKTEQVALVSSLPKTWKNYVPKIVWYGLNNQYHQWLFGNDTTTKGIVRGDFGLSYTTQVPIGNMLFSKFCWTLFFSAFAILIAIGISIPLAMYLSNIQHTFFYKSIQVGLYILYALPVFFVATGLLMLFANADVLNWFPTSGIKPLEGYSNEDSFFKKIMVSLPYCILPLICYSYTFITFLTKLTQETIRNEQTKDYVRTAKAKGLTDRLIIKKHILKNALLPVITVLGDIFPALLGGSVVIETIFTLPGLGLESIHAIQTYDYPVVMAIIVIGSVFTLFSYLICDIIYALIDPRINHHSL